MKTTAALSHIQDSEPRHEKGSRLLLPTTEHHPQGHCNQPQPSTYFLPTHTDAFRLLLFLTWKHDGCFIPHVGQLLQSSKTTDLTSEDEDEKTCFLHMRRSTVR